MNRSCLVGDAAEQPIPTGAVPPGVTRGGMFPTVVATRLKFASSSLRMNDCLGDPGFGFSGLVSIY